ncbi:MAG: hypothetical protein RLZ10_1021 [Bacteroidota bacterium]|jgi:asparagine synthase (glutamine-hydrolysing)
MSAFFGVFSPGGIVDRPAFDQMQKAILREGYDELETHVDDHIAMGHLMLRVTPESLYDKQPLKSSCGRYLLVGHFRLDYRDELGDKLGLTQKELDITPDSVLAMLAYQKWKDKCVRHIEGDWAFVVFDSEKKSIFLAKDSTGVSALFYSKSKCSIFFSSEPNIFLDKEIFSYELDNLQFAYFSLEGVKIDHGKTLLKDVYCLENGNFIEINQLLDLKKSVFLELDRIEVSKRFKQDEDLFFEFKSVYSKAVKSRCVCIGEIGLFLSGGLDSMSVASISSVELGQINKSLHAFTSVTSENYSLTEKELLYSDESSLVKEFVADKENVISRYCCFDDYKLSNTDLYSLRNDLFNPSVTLNSHWINGIMHIAKQDGIKILLTGQMGNFTISADGYFNYLELFLRFNFKTLYCELEIDAEKNNRSMLNSFKVRVINVCKYRIRSFLNQKSLFKKSFLEKYGVLRYSFYANLLKDLKQKKGFLVPGFFHVKSQRKLRIEQLKKNLYFSNTYWYLYGSKHGVQITDPTCDSRVVLFSLNISEEYFFKNGISKYLYKGMFTGLIHPRILNNSRTMVQSYDFGERLKADSNLHEFVKSVCNNRVYSEWMDYEILRKMANQIVSSEKPNFERQKIISFLHKISTINFLNNFNSCNFNQPQ